MKGLRRLLRLRVHRLSRLGKLRLFVVALVVLASAAAHIVVACHFVDVQPDDSKLYVQLAKNLIEQGVYSTASAAPFDPTLIRLPGYPVFLAAVYELFGVGNEVAVRVTQAVIYTLTCLLAALLAANWVGRVRRTRAGILTFIIVAFCPFTAIYSATLLTETTTMFFLAAMLLAATYAIQVRRRKRSLVWWVVSGVLGAAGVMLRPDAGLFVLGVGLTIAVSAFWGRGRFLSRLGDRMLKGIVFSIAFALMFVPWTIRNERHFGIFLPLAPTHAEMPGEFVPHGYYLWLRTWIDDSKFIGPMLWDLEMKPIKIESLPPSAFASEDEKQRISALIDQYNNSDPDHPAVKMEPETTDADNNDSSDSADDGSDDQPDPDDTAAADEGEWNLKISPDVDAVFEQTALERIAREPWRFYAGLPAKRAVSMWFDTHSDYYPFGGELFPLKDLDESTDQHIWLPFFAGLTLVYTLISFGGLLVLLIGNSGRSRLWFLLIMFVFIPRIMFLGTLENPEPRYLVEMFIPAAILGAIFLAKLSLKRHDSAIGLEFQYGNE